MSASASATERQVQRGADRVAHVEVALERRPRSSRATVSDGKSRPSWNERPSPRRARGAGRQARDVAARRRLRRARSCPSSAGEKPGDRVEQRRLAGAVRADEADDLAAAGRERHVGQRGEAAEALRHAVEPEPDRGRRACRRRSWPLPAARRRAPASAGTVGPTRAPSARRRRSSAPSRNTERSTSGRSSSSAVGPWKRISPFSMKYAVSAIVSARFTDCSTRMTVVPCVARCRARSASSCSTIVGREPERELVDHQQARLLDERHAEREHLLLAAGEVAGRLVEPVAQDREQLEHVLGRRRRRAALSLRCSHAASRRFSATVSDGNTPCAAGHLHDAAPGDLVRRRVGHVAAVEHDRAVGRLDEAGDRLQQRRLAGAVGAEQRDDLALVDLEVRRRTAPARRRSARRRCGRAAASPRPAGACTAPRPARRSTSTPG